MDESSYFSSEQRFKGQQQEIKMVGKYTNKGRGSSPMEGSQEGGNRNDSKSGNGTVKTFFIPAVTTMSESNCTPFKSGTLNSPVAQVNPDGTTTPLVMSGLK